MIGPISPAGRKYGAKRDFADRRDRLAPTRAVSAIPDFVDLRPYCGPIKQQGDLGSCTGHAYSSIMEWIQRKYFGKSPVLSPLFLYYMERQLEGTISSDDGAMPRSGCQVLTKFGVCEEKVDPYIPSDFALAPTQPQLDNAALWKCGAYHRINNTHDVLTCLGDPVPWPCSIAFSVYESFESEVVATTGVMPVPDQAKEAYLGGHEIAAFGFDIGDKPTLRPKGCPPAVLIQNSWSASWGLGGYFWLPIQVLNDANLVQDIWICHTGKPW